MHTETDIIYGERTVTSNLLERRQLHEVTTLAAEIRKLLMRHQEILSEEGIARELKQLEEWLEKERLGPAPAGIISEGGIAWLENLCARLKLSAEEVQRLEGEGGAPRSKEQVEKTEDLLRTIRRIDDIIHEVTAPQLH